jgi:hypothetical protein
MQDTPSNRPLRTILCGAILGLFLGSSCDTATTTPGGIAAAAAGCPDTSSVSAVAKGDWSGTFGIDAKAGAKIKAGIEAALELKEFSAKLDADLKGACGGLAKDLGQGGDFGSGTDACKAAMTALGEAKAKIGAGAKIKLDFEPPRCSASMDAYADCVGKCDVDVDPGKVDVKCEPGKLAGKCEAECKGSCDISGSAKCEGKCTGKCDASFSGSCGGECKGKCDGKTQSGGECNGKCEGSCSAQASGSCGGKCSGSCKMSGSAKCDGTCHGDCSVQMKAPKCEGKMEPPKASAECNARCDAKVTAEVECTPAQIVVGFDGKFDAAAAAKYKAALTKHLPGVLKIAVGLKDQAIGVAGNVKVVIDGVQSTIKAMSDAQAGARLATCVAAPFKAAFDAAASVQANVSVSVDVQASASGSASGSAGGSAG